MKKLFTKKIALAMAALTLVVLGSCKKTYTAGDNPYYNPNPLPGSGSPVPVIIGVTPAKVLPGSVITVRGYGFNTSLTATTATISGMPLVVSGIISKLGGPVAINELYLTVPLNASIGVHGRLEILNGTTSLTSSTNFAVVSGTQTTYKNVGAINLKNIMIDKLGNMYFTDGAKSIYKIILGGDVNLFAGGAASLDFGTITGMVTDAFGDIFITDRDKFKITRITTAGQVSTFAGSNEPGTAEGLTGAARFSAPNGIAIDGAGNMYINDEHRVRKINTSGMVSTLAGDMVGGDTNGTGAAAQFGNLEGIAVDSTGNVYVSDTKYFKIRKITPEGVVTTLAGTGTAGFTDGPGNTAQFNAPHNIAVDAGGNVFVADERAASPVYKVRMVNKLGIVTTILNGTTNTGVINGEFGTATTNNPYGFTIDILGNLYIGNSGAHTISKVIFQ